MPVNEFKTFAGGKNANVISQKDYEELEALDVGFQTGIARSEQLNKVWRQATTGVAALAQFVSDTTGYDVLDNGNVNDFLTKLVTAFESKSLSRKNPFGDIAADGNDAINQALKNLGLGEGSALPIGVPIPWPLATPPNGWLKCNGAAFDKTKYPKLATAYLSGNLPDLRGEFLRGWDDGRGVDSGRGLLSLQADDFKRFTLKYFGPSSGTGTTTVFALKNNSNGIYTSGISQGSNPVAPAFQVPGGNETRPRNVSFGYIVRAA